MVQPIDRAAFLAALQAAAQPVLVGVELPGVGACFKRQRTAGDVIDADEVRDTLQRAGMVLDAKVSVAIGLAQTLCDEAGAPLLDAANPDHVRLLVSLPWATLRSLVAGDSAGAEGDGPNA